MSKNIVSTEGCKSKWKQRGSRRSNKRSSPVESDDDIVDSIIKDMTRDVTSTEHKDIFRGRPDDDGIFHRSSVPRKRTRKQQHKQVIDNATTSSFGEQTIEYNTRHPSRKSGDANKELEDFIDSLLDTGDFKVSTWQNKKEETDANWEGWRSHIMTRYMESHAVIAGPEKAFSCFTCFSQLATMKCDDCMGSFLCDSCDRIIHAVNPLHRRKTWATGSMELLPLEFLFPVDHHYLFQCLGCGHTEYTDKEDGTYICITLKGRFDVPKAKRICMRCHLVQETHKVSNIIQRGFWPGNPDMTKTIYIFEIQLLETWHQISMNLPGSSVNGFVSALGDISEKYGRKRAISQTVFARVHAEWTYFHDELCQLKGQNSMECPPCHMDQTMGHVDGNHKLYRYSHVPRGTRKPYHEDRFIANDALVKDHIMKVYAAHPTKSSFQDIYCGVSKWKAAREVASRTKKLDETGLVVVGCRHAIAQKAVNMFAGELYGYSHFLNVNFLHPKGTRFFWGDVVCKYWPWAVKVGKSDPVWQSAVTAMRPALSVMHSKGHSWHCQISWGGRYVEGAAAGAGEDTEQIFSHMSRTGNTIKYMSAAARVDTLTNHALFWNERKIKKLPEMLCKRYQRMKQSMEDTKRSLAKYSTDAHVLNKWKDEVVKAAKDAGTRGTKTSGSGLQRYFVAKQQLREIEQLQTFVLTNSAGLSSLVGSYQLYQLATERQQKAALLREEVKCFESNDGGGLFEEAKKAAYKFVTENLQREIECAATGIKQRSQAASALAESCKQRTRLRAQNEKDTGKVKLLIEKLVQVHEAMGKRRTYKIADILNEKFPWKTTDVDKVDWATKKQAVDLYMFKQRLEEEKHVLNAEMKNCLMYYVNVKKTLEEEVTAVKDEIAKSASQSQSESTDEEQVQITSNRYRVANKEEKTQAALKGLLCVKKAGIQEVNDKIDWALTCFRAVLSADGWRSMIIEIEDEGEDDDDVDSEDVVDLPLI